MLSVKNKKTVVLDIMEINFERCWSKNNRIKMKYKLVVGIDTTIIYGY